jgi:hypothetical protein
MNFGKGWRTYVSTAVTGAVAAVIATAQANGNIDQGTADILLKYTGILGGVLTALFMRAALPK